VHLIRSDAAPVTALSNTKRWQDDRLDQRKPAASGGKGTSNELPVNSLRDCSGGVKSCNTGERKEFHPNRMFDVVRQFDGSQRHMASAVVLKVRTASGNEKLRAFAS
jgi:hypothetical protein